MKERGILLSLSAGGGMVELERIGACGGCGNRECHAKRRMVGAENKTGLPLAEGQQVELEIGPRSILGQAAFSLLPPLLGFPAGFFLAGLIPGWGPPLRIAGGFLLLLAAALLSLGIRRRFPPKENFHIVRLIHEAAPSNGGAAADLSAKEPI
jgi:sigma-E factor negative regulatory protein RseC